MNFVEPNLSIKEKQVITSIEQIRKNGNFQTLNKKIGREKLKSVLTSLYPKYNITEIEKIIGVPDSTLERWFIQLEIPLIRNHITNLSLPGNMNKTWIEEKNNNINKISLVEITPELAYVIGFALGDGSIQKYCVEVFNKDKELEKPLSDILKKFGTVTESKRDDGLWKLRLSSKRIAHLIKDENGIRKDTIEHIFNNEKLAKKFIAAFWDAEGSVLKHKNRFFVYLYNSDKWLVDKIRDFLKLKKIESSILSIDGRKRIYSYNGRPVISKKIIYRLSIPKKFRNKWIELIGINLLHSKKSKNVIEILGGIKNE